MRRLFLDLDGVFADFDAGYKATFGHDPHRDDDSTMWKRILSKPTWFRDLPPCPDALDAFEKLRHLNPSILTACPKSDYENVATQKRAWVREHLGADVTVLPVAGGSSKPLFMHAPGDMLVDDFSRNCEAWHRAGGHTIWHRGDWSQTLNMLGTAFRPFFPRYVPTPEQIAAFDSTGLFEGEGD